MKNTIVIVMILAAIVAVWYFVGKKKPVVPSDPAVRTDASQTATAAAAQTRVITVPRFVNVPIGIRYSSRTSQVRKNAD